MARAFPDGFLWGCATSAHQVEGGNRGCDWWEFEQSGGVPSGDSSDPACDQYRRFAEDYELLAKLGNNTHRLSIEWSRVQPSPHEFDEAAIEHYRDVLDCLRRNGMVPMVTLHHFTSPTWFARHGGWEASGAVEAWLRFVRKVADRLGELTGLWCTLNEPTVYAYRGWVSGETPPGRLGDVRAMHRVLSNMRTAHKAAYAALGRLTPFVPVGLAHEKWVLRPADPASKLDRLAAVIGQNLMDRWPTSSGRMEPLMQSPCDYLGLNHYSGALVAARGDPARGGSICHMNPPGSATSDLSWCIEPRWFRDALDEARTFGKPIYVTENGLATRDDSRRVQFLLDILDELWHAIQDGIDVRGYFHWSSHDNFEWTHGYAARYGLIAVDPITQERTVKPSGHLYARIARSNVLPLVEE